MGLSIFYIKWAKITPTTTCNIGGVTYANIP